MKIGIVSDSHGKARLLGSAIGLLVGRGAAAIVHCGDIGSSECLEALGQAGVPAYAVAGNLDRNIADMLELSERLGVHFAGEVITAPLGGGRSLAATHGHDEFILRELIAEERFPYVCCGHSHAASNEKVNSVRVINPGALHRPRGPVHPTCALLDTAADTVEFIKVE